MKSQRIVLTVGLATALASHAAFATPLYHLTSLDDFVYGMENINASGQLAGEVETLIGPEHVYLYSGGTKIDLGIFPGGNGGPVNNLNDLGQVVGWYATAPNNTAHAVLFANGTATTLGTPDDMNFPLDINNSGQIVGDVSDAQSKTHAILYSNGQFTDIGGFGGNFSIAVAINESGQIVGSSNFPGNGAGHAFRYSNGSMQDLGTLGGTSSSAADINASGQVVGSSSLPGNASTHAFVYTDGRMIDLGSLGRPFSGATAINASGWVVGSAGIYGERIPAFVYDGTTMFDLNNLLDASGTGWTVSNATDINDAGWIAAEGNFNGGVFHVLLTPVPEPTAGALLGAAIMILGGFAWRRRRFCSGNVPGRRPITSTAARPD